MERLGDFRQIQVGVALSRNILRKEFLKAGVPWVYEPEKTDDKNSRHKKPKLHKSFRDRAVRLSELKSLVERNDQMIMEYRNEMLNNRKYKGTARFVKEFVPSWLSFIKTAERKGPVNSKGSDLLGSVDDPFLEGRKQKQKTMTKEKKPEE